MSWREFTGTMELIEEGDEEMHKDYESHWFPVDDDCINTIPKQWSNYRFRTRRPLPDHLRDATKMDPQEWWNTQGLRRFVPGESFEDSMKWAYTQGQQSR